MKPLYLNNHKSQKKILSQIQSQPDATPSDHPTIGTTEKPSEPTQPISKTVASKPHQINLKIPLLELSIQFIHPLMKLSNQFINPSISLFLNHVFFQKQHQHHQFHPLNLTNMNLLLTPLWNTSETINP